MFQPPGKYVPAGWEIGSRRLGNRFQPSGTINAKIGKRDLREEIYKGTKGIKKRGSLIFSLRQPLFICCLIEMIIQQIQQQELLL